MPILTSAVPELESHVFYPVIKQMAHKVIEDLCLQHIFKNNIFVETGFSNPKNFRDGKNNAMLQISKIRAQAEINTNPQNLKWDNITFEHALEPLGFSHTTKDRDFRIIFTDPSSHITISEMTLPTYISINCTMTVLDRTIAYQIPSMLYRHYPPNIPSVEHIAYDFPVPKPTIALLYMLYKLKRFNKPNTFRQWMDLCSIGNSQFAINRVATKEELVMKRVLMNSLFMLDYSDSKPQEVQINRSVNQYDLQFTIHIQFSRTDMLIVDYPIVLDNRLLPAELIPETLHKSEPIPNLKGPYPNFLLNKFLEKKIIKPVMIKFPDYDDWYVKPETSIIQRSYRPWFSSIFTMDEENKTTELPIGGVLDEELGYRLHPLVIWILKEQGKYSFYDDVIFNIAVFNNDIQVEKTYLDIDENLNIKVNCIDPSVVRRLVISEIQDVKYLNPIWKDLYHKYLTYIEAIRTGKDPSEIDKNFDSILNQIGGSNGTSVTLGSTNSDIIVRSSNPRNG